MDQRILPSLHPHYPDTETVEEQPTSPGYPLWLLVVLSIMGGVVPSVLFIAFAAWGLV